MTEADRLEARYQELVEQANQMDKDILLLHNSGISRESPIYKAAEREVHRASDKLIAATEMRNAVGTGAEEVEANYQDLWWRSTRLQDALVCLFDAGIAAGSPIHKLVEAEADRLGDALNAADGRRSAVRAMR